MSGERMLPCGRGIAVVSLAGHSLKRRSAKLRRRMPSDDLFRRLTVTRLFAGTPLDRPPRCARCGELESVCVCPPAPRPRTPAADQTARLSVEKRRKGKIVTVIAGLASEPEPLSELLTRLKNACGAGGAVKDSTLEIQGDHQQRIRDVLRELGYRVKP